MNERQTIFIFEPHASLRQRCIDVAKEADYDVVSASTTEEATAMLEDPALSALLISSCPASTELCDYVREFTTSSAAILALVQRDDEDRDETVAKMGADGFLVQPFSATALQSVLSVAVPAAQVRRGPSIQDQPSQLRQLASAVNSRTGFYKFDFIKDLLVVEVRRAKRYGYPLALLLVGLDLVPELDELNRPNIQREITGGLAVAIAKSIRDIDIPIHYADDRILVFLPHTDLAGAEEVGRRIKRRIKRITYRGDGMTAQLTASVGVAGVSVGHNLTFSRLIKDASAALKAAQLKGGDRVMKRVHKNAPEI